MKTFRINNLLDTGTRHPKCLGYEINTTDCRDYDCEYGSNLTCEECKYGVGKKDPEAKCNQ
jgi:hypothetical protein